MNISKFINLLVERRLPWTIQKRLELANNRRHFSKKLQNNRNDAVYKTKTDKTKTILFKCGFHGKSGGLYAIANIANLLSQEFYVEFVSYPESNFNPILEHAVHIVTTPNLDADLVICDVSCEHEFFVTLKQHAKPCVVSCHGLLDDLHGLSPNYVAMSLNYADKVHFVSFVQQQSFRLPDGTYEIIPNTTTPISKYRHTNSVGTVGNLGEERKNAKEALAIALESEAEEIHLWGSDQKGLNGQKIIVHPWESDKEKIYNSFDVLVFMSQQENCPMVVIESLSAGMPCLLSSIEAMKPFAACPGVRLINEENRPDAPRILNDLLNRKDELREPIKEFWKKNYSEQVILHRWMKMLSEVAGMTCKELGTGSSRQFI